MESGRKRSLPVRDTSRSANYGRRFYKRASDSHPRLSSGRDRNSRPFLPSSAGYQSRGIVEALHEMFLASRPKFVGMAYSILRNREDAEDAVQDAVLSAYVHLRNFEGRSAFTTCFTRIVRNAALMLLRKRTNSRIDSLPDSSASLKNSWTHNIPASPPDTASACVYGDTLHLL